MVWNQRGKKGVHCGRTLRRNVSNFRRQRLDETGLIVKYPRHAEGFSRFQKESLLEDRYGLDDGFTPSMETPRNRFQTDIEFSLGKRKRWLLPELVQEKMSFDCEDMLEDEEDKQELNVCFVERHIHREMSRSKGDCVSFFSDKDGKLLTPKHKYSYQTDIRHLGKEERPPEICYEICRPPPPASWPNMKEDTFIYEKYDKMGQIKSKGHKSKGLRWGIYNDKDLSLNKSKEFLSDMPKLRCAQTMESKIKTVSNEQFSEVVRKMEANNGESSSRFTIPMGNYLDTLFKGKGKDHTEDMKCKMSSRIPSSPVKMGKGCAIFVDPEPVTKQGKVVKSVVHPDPTSSLKESKCQVEVDIAMQDLSVSKLESEWSDIYSEGEVYPRKFTFDITNLLPRTSLGFSCVILFEVGGKALRGETSAKTTISLVPVVLGSEVSDYTKAMQNFVSKIAETNRAAPLRIKEIVNASIEVFAITPCGKEPLERTDRNMYKTTVKGLAFLNGMCGWKSESFSLDGAKQQLKDDYQKVVSKCSIKSMVLDSHWMMPSVECGICFESFEGDDTMLTSLKECGHAFCNDCWEGHLKTQIKQGIQCIECPGQNCASRVDDTMIMSIVPTWYGKFLNMMLNKKLEASPNYKWCPGTGCKKVVKATAPGPDAMTALCDCGMAWCFKCQQPCHWPATCEESKTFDKIGRDYKEALLDEKKDLITSVLVKNCPNCDYPIEKHFGCQFMTCVLCNIHFCWNCSTPATYSHHCDKEETHNLAKVEFSFKRKKYQFEKFLNIVVKSTQARLPKRLSAKGTKAKALETGVSSYKAISSKTSKASSTESDISRVMSYVVENGLSQTLREAVEFEFQAHLVLEGFAKKAAVSKSQCRSGLHTMSQLAFVVDRIDYLCHEPFSLCKDGRIQRLEKLVAIGKDCILTLKKCCTN